ncbi:MAG TPA: TonB-dependent receptor [Chitinophagales bacterium]|nr:TonB-dependent receptor [Chitinophagales bacterium]
MKYPKVFFAVMIFLSGESPLFAQKGILKGQVTDTDSKEPLPFLNVYVSDKSVGTTTDFDGNYELQLEPGAYEIIYSSMEYGKTSRSVTLNAGETQTLNVSLEKADIKMETILVKTDKYARPIEEVVSSLDVLKPNIIENKGVTDVTEALEQAPGLTIVDNEPQLRAGSGYSFGAGSRVAILVDDMPIMSGDAGRPSWGFIPIENIEQVEIIKGASSVLYGSSALNGVINVRTAYPKSVPLTKINLITGIYDKPAREEAKWWEENFPFYTNMNFLHSRKVNTDSSKNLIFSFVIGGNLQVENGFIGPPPSDAEDKVPEWNRLLSQGKITAAQYNDSLEALSKDLKKGEFTNRGRINFNTYFKLRKLKGLAFGLNGNAMYGRSAGSLIWLNNTDGLLRAYPGALTTTLQPSLNFDPYVSYFDQRGNKYSFNSRVFYQNNDNDNNQQNNNTVFYGEFRYMKNLQKIKDFTISAGLTGNYVIAKSELYAGNYNQGMMGVYLQIDKKFWDKLTVTAGGRWEYFKVSVESVADNGNGASVPDSISNQTDNQPVGRFGFSYKAHKETYIRASFGQGFRFPTIAERFIETTVGGVPINANPNLKSEKSWNAEAGIKQGIKIKRFLGYLDVAGFVSQYQDYIEFIAAFYDSTKGLSLAESGLAFKSQNTHRTRVSGVEITLMGQGQFTDNFGINVLAGYTWAKPIALDPHQPFAVDDYGKQLDYINTSSDTTDYILKYRYQHIAKVDLELNYKNLSVGGSFKYYSFMQNVDSIFYSPAIEFIGIKARDYREANEHPEFVVDIRVSYQIASHSKVAFIINNLNNREYALRPLVMNAPRSYALQYSLNF